MHRKTLVPETLASSVRTTASAYGDGDSKSFNSVQILYGDEMPVKEYECIGHYQKRVDNWLRKLLIIGYKPTFVDVYTQKK